MLSIAAAARRLRASLAATGGALGSAVLPNPARAQAALRRLPPVKIRDVKESFPDSHCVLRASVPLWQNP